MKPKALKGGPYTIVLTNHKGTDIARWHFNNDLDIPSDEEITNAVYEAEEDLKAKRKRSAAGLAKAIREAEKQEKIERLEKDRQAALLIALENS
jgi:hypothetical protein